MAQPGGLTSGFAVHLGCFDKHVAKKENSGLASGAA